MQLKKQPCLRMGTFLLLFLFTSEEACAGITIKSVELIIYPSEDVESGTNVSLKCQENVSQSQGSHANYEYIFYKDYQPLNTNAASTTGIYSIPDARVSHSGKYKCAVYTGKENKESRNKDLTVKGLVKPILTVDKQILTEGEEVTAVCTAKGEVGFLTFFFKNGSDELYRSSTYGHQVEIKMRPVETLNMFCYYSINLDSMIKKSDNSEIINVDIKELQIKPNIKVTPSTNVIEGDPLTFSCSVNMTHQDNSNLKIILSHGSTTLSSNMTQKDYEMTAKADDSGTYDCISSLGNIHKSSSVTITVKELFSMPVMSIQTPEVFEDENFTISCHSNRSATERIQKEDVKYIIFRDNTTVKSGDTYNDIASKVTNGNYICSAEAKGIIKESRTVPFTAKVPVIKPEITVDGLVIVDRPFWIHCYSKNGSLPITYSLKKNNFTLNSTKVSNLNEEARFLTRISTPSDISNFFCEAQNNQRVSAKIGERLYVDVIVPVGKPLLTVIPVPGNIEEGVNVTLICGIAKGSPPINFTFYGSNSQAINTTTVKSNSSSIVLSAVSQKDSGNYYCMAINKADKLSKSDTVTVEVSLAKWKKALITAFCMLLVVLLVLFIVKHYKAKRGKRKMAAELSVKPARPKSDDSLTLSFTHDTLYSGHTVGVNESVWSKRPPDVADQDSIESPTEGDVEYTEVVHAQPVDPTRIPLRKGTDTVYSELQTTQGHPEHIDHQGLLEYAELNHDLPEPVE